MSKIANAWAEFYHQHEPSASSEDNIAFGAMMAKHISIVGYAWSFIGNTTMPESTEDRLWHRLYEMIRDDSIDLTDDLDKHAYRVMLKELVKSKTIPCTMNPAGLKTLAQASGMTIEETTKLIISFDKLEDS